MPCVGIVPPAPPPPALPPPAPKSLAPVAPPAPAAGCCGSAVFMQQFLVLRVRVKVEGWANGFRELKDFS